MALTVHSLLQIVHRPHTKHPSHIPGYDMDHIVELQLVVAALNQIPSGIPYNENSLRQLVDFFGTEGNMQLLDHALNQQKGQIVQQWIRDPYNRQHLLSNYWMTLIRNKWIQLRDVLRGYELFKQSLNNILQVC